MHAIRLVGVQTRAAPPSIPAKKDAQPADKTTVRLWFRDRQREIEVRMLTADARQMSGTAELLRANGR